VKPAGEEDGPTEERVPDHVTHSAREFVYVEWCPSPDEASDSFEEREPDVAEMVVHLVGDRGFGVEPSPGADRFAVRVAKHWVSQLRADGGFCVQLVLAGALCTLRLDIGLPEHHASDEDAGDDASSDRDGERVSVGFDEVEGCFHGYWWCVVFRNLRLQTTTYLRNKKLSVTYQ